MRRERLKAVAREEIGPYTLLRVERGGLDPGAPGQFFMLEAPGRLLPRPMSLCFAPRGELAFLIDPIGPGTRAICTLEPGDELQVLGPLGNGFRLELGRPPPDLRIDLPPVAAIEPKLQRCALFPSTLYHGTRRFCGGKRMTVAIDIQLDRG